MAKSELGVRPLHDRILVRRMAEEEKTAGGLFIPDTAKEKPQKGEIVATGKGRITEDGKTLPLYPRRNAPVETAISMTLGEKNHFLGCFSVTTSLRQ